MRSSSASAAAGANGRTWTITSRAKHEPIWRSKAAFWTLTIAFAALAAVPSIVLLGSLRQYVQFLSGWEPGVLRATSMRRVPHRSSRKEESLPDVEFVEFRLVAPKAKQVLLAGDFNQWRPETLPLKRGKDGAWTTLLPLPPGRYEYAFQVDGRWQADPQAPVGAQYPDHPASLKEVH